MASKLILHFHLTAKWFERIKSGEKDVEFRESRKFSDERLHLIMESLYRGDLYIRFYYAYPSLKDKSCYFDCKCVKIDARYLNALPSAERIFFVDRGITDGLFYGFHVKKLESEIANG